jgi:hypothetical protein
MQRVTLVLLLPLVCGPFACGGSGHTPAAATAGDDGGSDGGDDGGGAPVEAGPVEAAPPLDHGAPSTTYPAFTPDVAQIAYNAGYVMTVPVIVPITWNADRAQSKFDSFVGAVGTTSYFHQTTSEYGVMAAVAGTPVHIASAPPAQLSDSDIQNLIVTNVTSTTSAGGDGGSDAGDADGGAAPGEAGAEVDAGSAEGGSPAAPASGWPAPTENTIYALFLPPNTSLNTTLQGVSGDACSLGIGGYHDQVTVGRVTTSYAVVASCDFGRFAVDDESTLAMSHEIIEASTDPHPQDKFTGWTGFDPDHFAFDWYQQFQSEVGDACEFFLASAFEDIETSPSFDFYVQRTWSNGSAAAGHDPCVPRPAGAYFNVTPMNLTYVSLTLPPQVTGYAQPVVFTTRGIRVLPGDTGTIELGFYSDIATGPGWTVSAAQYPPHAQGLSVSIDKPIGRNGDKAYATVSVTKAGSMGGELVVFSSYLGGVTHVLPVVVSSM